MRPGKPSACTALRQPPLAADAACPMGFRVAGGGRFARDVPSRPMSAPVLMVLASLLFATMGVCVKLASAQYHTGEIVFYRGLIGALFIAGMTRVRGGTLKTAVPGMHFWRALSGVCALCLWFYAIGHLPLATAVTLN